jgi:hypothetical protein
MTTRREHLWQRSRKTCRAARVARGHRCQPSCGCIPSRIAFRRSFAVSGSSSIPVALLCAAIRGAQLPSRSTAAMVAACTRLRPVRSLMICIASLMAQARERSACLIARPRQSGFHEVSQRARCSHRLQACAARRGWRRRSSRPTAPGCGCMSRSRFQEAHR